MPVYRSRTTTQGRNMAGARALWRATGMKDGDFDKPIIAVANSFTQFVPGHVHLKDMGQLVAREIEAAGGVAKEFNTIAVDDGIAMGHGGMLYSLPSRDIIADSVEYMVNAHCADALVCISNCDKITPGMLMAALRLNIPAVFVSGGPMEAGKVRLAGRGDLKLDLVDAMVAAADPAESDADVAAIERSACPTCGSCSGMFTANSMNCLTEALGLSLPGNGTLLATHAAREDLFLEAGRLAVALSRRWYEQDDASALPRSIATREAFENAMSLDIAMGGSTNTVLHLLAAAHEAEVDFTMADMDALKPQGAQPVQGRPFHPEVPHGGRPPRRRRHRHPGRARPRRAAPPRGADGPQPRPWARPWTLWDVRRPGRGARPRALSGRPRRRPDPGRLQPVPPVAGPGPGPRRRLHPRPGARLLAATAAWRSCSATWPSTAASSRPPGWTRPT